VIAHDDRMVRAGVEMILNQRIAAG
jgi:hypothetical protein